MSLSIENESDARAAVKDVRDDNSATDWVLFSYTDPKAKNPTSLSLIGKGEDGVNGLVAQLAPDMVGYGIIRVLEQIDDTQAVKFVYIKFQGEQIPRLLKARLGTHSGAIRDLLHPYHVTIDTTDTKDINSDNIMDKVGFASGTKSAVRAAPAGGAKEQWTPKAGTGSVQSPTIKIPKDVGDKESLKFVDESALRADIKDVRDDNSATNWVAIGYQDKDTLVTLGKGSGGPDELKALLANDNVVYGLVRLIEQIDETSAVKFCFVEWKGSDIPRMFKARLSTHKGVVDSLVAPYHVAMMQLDKSDEVSEEKMMRKIAEASGTASHVK